MLTTNQYEDLVVGSGPLLAQYAKTLSRGYDKAFVAGAMMGIAIAPELALVERPGSAAINDATYNALTGALDVADKSKVDEHFIGLVLLKVIKTSPRPKLAPNPLTIRDVESLFTKESMRTDIKARSYRRNKAFVAGVILATSSIAGSPIQPFTLMYDAKVQINTMYDVQNYLKASLLEVTHG